MPEAEEPTADVVIVVHEPPTTLQGIVDEVCREHFPGMVPPELVIGPFDGPPHSTPRDDFAEVWGEIMDDDGGRIEPERPGESCGDCGQCADCITRTIALANEQSEKWVIAWLRERADDYDKSPDGLGQNAATLRSAADELEQLLFGGI
jgi:hypothetical protein